LTSGGSAAKSSILDGRKLAGRDRVRGLIHLGTRGELRVGQCRYLIGDRANQPRRWGRRCHILGAHRPTDPLQVPGRGSASGCVDTNDMRSSSQIWTGPQSDRSRYVPSGRSDMASPAQTDDPIIGQYTYPVDVRSEYNKLSVQRIDGDGEDSACAAGDRRGTGEAVLMQQSPRRR
jgi:hypothetical protein